ncbi:MAG: hypothetical protein ACRDZO_06495 [Egibacteraceae bacterium]
MKTAEVTFTSFLRDPNGVTALLQDTDVELSRRSDAPLLLTLASRGRAVGEASSLLARVLRDVAATVTGHELLAKAFLEEFPWVDLLPRDIGREFVEDVLRAAAAAADLGRPELIAQALHEWRATAEIYTVPELAAELRRPLPEPDESPRVPVPVGE